jgi:hypothetical protein
MQAIGRWAKLMSTRSPATSAVSTEILSTIESSVAFQGQPENTFDPLTSPGGFSD